MLDWRSRIVVALTLASMCSSVLAAQELAITPVPVDSVSHGRATAVALTGALILAGAAGAQALHTPKAWPRTFEGFGKRVADQTGFYLAQAGVSHVVSRATRYRPDDTSCSGQSLIPCAVARTFTARDSRNVRRANLPFLISTLAATAASVTWRPERETRSQALSFVATRVGVVFAGFIAERVLLEWRRRD
ncbi:MAG: hypothetical protein H7099_01500 [Gemmatimonadaceae bacterium]|nr:hypothetical protein [Gemmatimonadaceae bacterium]